MRSFIVIKPDTLGSGFGRRSPAAVTSIIFWFAFLIIPIASRTEVVAARESAGFMNASRLSNCSPVVRTSYMLIRPIISASPPVLL